VQELVASYLAPSRPLCRNDLIFAGDGPFGVSRWGLAWMRTNGEAGSIGRVSEGLAALDAGGGVGHVVSALGWGSHSLAPLSFRRATYSGVFTLYPLISGEGRIHHGEILAQGSALADAGKLRPLPYKESLNIRDIGIAHDLVASGTQGKVVVEL
jgi:NADPH:quinone reductase